jgi:hypothetical protein
LEVAELVSVRSFRRIERAVCFRLCLVSSDKAAGTPAVCCGYLVASITPLVWVFAASEVTIRFAVFDGTVAACLRVDPWQDVGLLFRFA